MSPKKVATTLSFLAECSHIFCCGIPMTVALLTTFGQVTGLSILMAYHDMMHAYELAILAGSGAVIILAVILQYISFKLDCHKEYDGHSHCEHGDCTPKKFRASKMLLVACTLFCMNVIIYFVHRQGEENHAGHDHTAHHAEMMEEHHEASPHTDDHEEHAHEDHTNINHGQPVE